MASRSAISSRSCAYAAIHAVESACSRYPSDGGRVDRSSGAMLSSPMNPPWNRLFPP